MDNNEISTLNSGYYKTFFKKSSEIVKYISDSFIYDPKNTNPETNLVWDQAISQKIRDELKKNKELKGFSFYSEEEPGESLKPPLFLIDPIDGSREFLLNVPECAVCMSFVNSWKLEGNTDAHWIWNFRNNYEVMLIDGKIFHTSGDIPFQNKKRETLHGLVSRREWEEGVFRELEHNIHLEPVGSIAYKLALLSQGYCDFVYSKSNKNIWDIAAGSFILERMGYSFYNRHGKLKELKGPLLEGPMLWCQDEHYSKLSKVLKK